MAARCRTAQIHGGHWTSKISIMRFRRYQGVVEIPGPSRLRFPPRPWFRPRVVVHSEFAPAPVLPQVRSIGKWQGLAQRRGDFFFFSLVARAPHPGVVYCSGAAHSVAVRYACLWV